MVDRLTGRTGDAPAEGRGGNPARRAAARRG